MSIELLDYISVTESGVVSAKHFFKGMAMRDIYKVVDSESSFFGMTGEFNREFPKIGQVELWILDGFRGTWLFSPSQLEKVS